MDAVPEPSPGAAASISRCIGDRELFELAPKEGSHASS